MSFSRFFSLLVLMSGVALTSACSPMGAAAGAGAWAGTAAVQEGGFKTAVSDTKIKATINDLWFKYSLEAFSKLSVTVDQGRVLVTGVVQNPEHRVEAIRLAWQAEGVKQVINEIRIDESKGFTGYMSDTLITSKLRTAITLDKEILSLNYSIDTVQGVVYLMGVAQHLGELNKVIEHARMIKNVKDIVSYVKMKGEEIGDIQDVQDEVVYY